MSLAARPSIARARSRASPSDTAASWLVWFEPHERMDEAIAREKQIKSGIRKGKLAPIERDIPSGTISPKP